jgi:EF hand
MIITRRTLVGSLPQLAAMASVAGLYPFRAGAVPTDGGPWPNVFISPCGWPFRAKEGAPYPVGNWFKHVDKNADGRIDKAEFLADTEIFFNFLDQNKDGVLGPEEVDFYEHRIAPEVLGGRVEVSDGRARRRVRNLCQMGGQPGGQGGAIDRPAPIDPGGPPTDLPPHHDHLDESGEGAAPYSFFDEPEPVTAADLDFRGLILKAEFMKLADAHFTTLDRDNQGFLTLAGLPKTPVQKRLEKTSRRGG